MRLSPGDEGRACVILRVEDNTGAVKWRFRPEMWRYSARKKFIPYSPPGGPEEGAAGGGNDAFRRIAVAEEVG